MNIKYLFIIGFFAFTSMSFAQDSIQFVHYQNGRSVYGSSPDSSIYYFNLCAKRGYELKEDSITLTTISNCIHNIGFIYREVKNQIYQSLIFLDSAKVIYSRYGDKNLLSRSYFNIGESYYELGDYNTAIDYYNEAIKFSIKTNDKFIHVVDIQKRFLSKGIVCTFENDNKQHTYVYPKKRI